MSILDSVIKILTILLFVSFFGYFFSVIKEKYDLINNRVVIKSKSITQKLIDEIDLKMFKLGNIKLNIGDNIKVYLKNSNSIKGTVLGAKKSNNSLLVLTIEDNIMELKVNNIKKLKIISRYGKIL